MEYGRTLKFLHGTINTLQKGKILKKGSLWNLKLLFYGIVAKTPFWNLYVKCVGGNMNFFIVKKQIMTPSSVLFEDPTASKRQCGKWK